MEAYLPRLLLVHDDAPGLEGLASALESVAEVETCSSGESAVSRVARKVYDIVVTDYGLPGMNGEELLHAVSSREPDAAGLLIATSDEYRVGPRPGRHRVLLKPVEPSRLCATVRQLASIVRMRRTVSMIREP
jgi:two-component system chemotaxis response regulator CheY